VENVILGVDLSEIPIQRGGVMAKKVPESGGVSGAKKSALSRKRVSAAKKGVALAKKVAAAKPVRVKAAVKVSPSELKRIEREETKAVEARGFIVERICVTPYNRRPRRLKSEKGPRMIVGYMRSDGLFVNAIVDVPEVPPERRSPYGIFKRPPSERPSFKIVDKKLEAALYKQLRGMIE